MPAVQHSKSHKITLRWRRLFRLIPGYDPIATAKRGHWFDEQAAVEAINFFPGYLKHVKGDKAGQTFELEDWQKAHIGCTFGWKNADGTRRYREVLIYVAKKNGKTCEAAGIVLLVAFTDGEVGAELYSTAGDREQAALIYNTAKEMVLQSEELSEHAAIYETNKIIVIGTNRYKALSSEAKTKEGINTHLAINDELHVQPNRQLIDAVETSTAARSQPLIIHITTADYKRESICNEKYNHACDVRDGRLVDPEFLPVIFEATKEDDWTKPATWRKANPNLGVSVSEKYIRDKCKKAERSLYYRNTFLRFHLNLQTEQEVRWLAMDFWRDSAADVDPVKWRRQAIGRFKRKSCIGAIDLGATSDLTSLMLLFESQDQKYKFEVLPYFWVPKDTAERRELKEGVPYLTWSKLGYIKLTGGNTADYDEIRLDVNRLADDYGIEDTAVDRLFQGAQLCNQLMNDGFEITAFGQGFMSMAAPTKWLEELVLDNAIGHGGNPVLNWMASNVFVEFDGAGNMKPNKKKSNEKIDGIVTLIMCLGRKMALEQKPKEESVYKTRGVRTI